jgi:hypothetical protein
MDCREMETPGEIVTVSLYSVPEMGWKLSKIRTVTREHKPWKKPVPYVTCWVHEF